MADRFQQFDINLGFGMDRKTDPRRILPGKLVLTRNVVVRKSGRLDQRKGNMQMGQTGVGTTAHSIFAVGDQLFLINRDVTANIRGYNATKDDWGNAVEATAHFALAEFSSLQHVNTRGQQLYGSFTHGAGQTIPPVVDVATVGSTYTGFIARENSQATGWLSASASSICGVMENATQRYIWLHTEFEDVSGGHIGSVVSLSTSFVFLRAGDSSNDAFVISQIDTASSSATLDATTSTLWGPTAIPDFSTNVAMCADSQNSKVWIAYLEAGTGKIALYGRTLGGTVTNNLSTVTATRGLNVFKHPDLNFLFITFFDSTNAARFITFNIGTPGFSAATNFATGFGASSGLHTAACKADSTRAFLVADGYDGSGVERVAFSYGNSSASISTPTYHIGQNAKSHTLLATQPIFVNSRPYLTLTRDDTNQPLDVLVTQLQATLFTSAVFNAQAIISSDDGPGARPLSQLPHFPQSATDMFVTVYPRLEDAITGTIPSSTYSLRLVECDFTGTYPAKAIQSGNSYYVTGGYLGVIKDNLSPACPLESPTIAITANASTGGNIDGNSKTYQFIAVWEYRGSDGLLRRSTASNIVSITLSTATTTSTITVVAQAPLYRNESVNSFALTLYRTADDGTVFYRDTSILSDGDTDVTIVSTCSNVSLTTNAFFDIDELGLEATPVPGAWDIASWGNRPWVVPSLDRQSIWYGKEFSDRRGSDFNPEFRVPIPEQGDAIGIAPLGNTLVIFKKSGIYAITGEGPANDGTGGSFSTPQRIHESIGAISRDSIVVTPVGIFFQSTEGMRLLSTSLNLATTESGMFVGSELDEYMTLNSENDTQILVVKGVHLPVENEVRWTTYSNAGFHFLSYNYMFNQWGLHAMDIATPNVRSGTLWNNRHVFLNNNKPYIQRITSDANEFSDDSTVGLWLIQTGWISLAGIAGLQFLRRFTVAFERWTNIGGSVWPGNANITINWKVDNNSTRTRTINLSTLSAPVDVQIVPEDQGGTRIYFEILSQAGGIRLSGIQLEVQVSGEQLRIGADHRT